MRGGVHLATEKWTAKQLQDYYNRKSKKGAVYVDKLTGETRPVSDFARGVAHEKANQIFKARRKKAKEMRQFVLK